jgi:hypothetical protein
VPADPSEPTQTSEVVVTNDAGDRRQNDRDVDLDRDRGSDLETHEQDDPIVWFDPELLAAASAIEIGSHALEIAVLRSGPDRDQLTAAIATPGLSLACLPGWPGSGASGQGWGVRLDALIGPIRPGFVGLIGSDQRGAGRTSWLAQLADGLALRESDSLLTPVIGLVDDDPRIWRARSLGRWAGIDPRTFLGHGDLAAARSGLDALAGEWRGLVDRQRFGSPALLDEPGDLLAAIERWRAELTTGPAAIWPVLVIDTLDSPARIPALARMADRHGLIILASLDDAELGRAEDRHLDLRLRLRAHDDELELELAHVRLGPRGCVRVGWDRRCGRFDGDREPK